MKKDNTLLIDDKLIKELYYRFVPCGDAEDVICFLKDLKNKKIDIGDFEK